MKRFHMLLLASAMLLPIGASVASAQMPYISGVPGDDPDYFPGDKYSCSDDENLNPEEEQRQVDAIKAKRREVLSESRMREIRVSADRRKENKAALKYAEWLKEKAREEERGRVRRSQCTIPAL